ncbi:MAG: tripartite tricarboxylate transporter substrate binding protein [Burkholderiales bacterium]
MWRSVATLVAAMLLAAPAHAQAYPQKPIRFILPFPTGSATDQIARVVGKDMAETLGQPVVVENKPGAGGAIAAEFVAKSPPDGYTLFVGSNTQLAANPSLFKTLSYNPVTDFSPVVRMTTQPSAFLVKPDFPAKNIAEFVAVAKASPKKLSAGYGASSAQVAIARLEKLAGFEALGVPYKGIPLAVVDTIGGTVDFTVGDMGSAIAQVKGGKLKSLGVTSEKRNPLVPDWPTVSETYPGFDVIGWHAIVAPPNTPRDIRMKLYDAAAKALAKKEVIDALGGMGVTPGVMNPEELGAFIPAEVKRWGEMIKEAGIQPE